MISQELKDKLSKVYELVKRGSEGERQAAEAAMSRIIEKYNLQGIDLESLDKKTYYCTYTNNLETRLFEQIVYVMLDHSPQLWKQTWDGNKAVKNIKCDLTYVDWITVHSAYEYFRGHMRIQWKKACLDVVRRKRSTKTKNKAREELQHAFWQKYIFKSNLYKEQDLVKLDWKDLSMAERKARETVMEVEGGRFNKQVTNGLALNERN